MKIPLYFNDFVNKSYDVLKNIAIKESNKRIINDSIEDIFHDTLIKCIQQLENKLMSESEYIAYFTKAIQINIIRETQYAYNLLKTDVEDIENWDGELTETNINSIDFKNILCNIEKTFNEQWKNVFQLWLNGLTIQDINEKLKIRNSRYIVDKVKEWVKITYQK